MKRIIALSLCILTLFLCACQPTPDHDIIINQGEADQAGMGKRNTPKPAEPGSTEAPVVYYHETRASIPEHYKLDRQAYSSQVSVEIDADVLFDKDGVFPVYEVQKRDLLSDTDLMKRFITLLCPGSTAYYEWEPTKDDIKVQLDAAVSYHGQADSVVEIDDNIIRYFQDAFKKAPDKPDKKPANPDAPMSVNDSYYLERPDGTIGYLLINGINAIAYNSSPYLWTYYKWNITQRELDLVEEIKISQQEAKQQADDLLTAMGFTGYSIIAADEMAGIMINTNEWAGSYWMLDYGRAFGNTMTIDERKAMFHGFTEDKSMDSSVGAPWEGIETIRIIVGREGVVSVVCKGLTETVDEMENDVPFIDFDSLIERMTAHLGHRFGYKGTEKGGSDRVISVSAIQLVYGLTCYKDRPDSGIYMPMWEIEFTQSDDMNELKEQQVYFSAIDGSPMEPRAVLSNELYSTTPLPNGQLPRH